VGDTLLLVADPNFRNRWGDRRDFLLVAPLGGSPPVTTRRAIWVGAIALGIVVASALHILPIVEASLIGAIVLVLTGVLSAGEARDAVDLDVIILIASAFGLAAAIQESGLADSIASGLVAVFEGLGPIGILAGVVIGTVILTELVTNNAAALLMFPIALSSAAKADLDPRGFAVAIAVAASASFLTPIGYQTNTMVYGPGGYRYTDYARLGIFLTATVLAVTLVTVPIFWPLGR
jgi:di/tricarboxylate transporter